MNAAGILFFFFVAQIIYEVPPTLGTLSGLLTAFSSSERRAQQVILLLIFF